MNFGRFQGRWTFQSLSTGVSSVRRKGGAMMMATRNMVIIHMSAIWLAYIGIFQTLDIHCKLSRANFLFSFLDNRSHFFSILHFPSCCWEKTPDIAHWCLWCGSRCYVHQKWGHCVVLKWIKYETKIFPNYKGYWPRAVLGVFPVLIGETHLVTESLIFSSSVRCSTKIDCFTICEFVFCSRPDKQHYGPRKNNSCVR